MKECKSHGGHVDGHHKEKKHKLEHHRAKGGHVDGEGKDEPLKKGGAVKKKHHEAHHAHGEAPKHRVDKRARGGKVMTPKSPLSGAKPSKDRPGFSEKFHIGKEDD